MKKLILLLLCLCIVSPCFSFDSELQYQKELNSAVNYVSGFTYLMLGTVGLQTGIAYGTVTGAYLIFRGTVCMIRAMRKKSIICEKCGGIGEIKAEWIN